LAPRQATTVEARQLARDWVPSLGAAGGRSYLGSDVALRRSFRDSDSTRRPQRRAALADVRAGCRWRSACDHRMRPGNICWCPRPIRCSPSKALLRIAVLHASAIPIPLALISLAARLSAPPPDEWKGACIHDAEHRLSTVCIISSCWGLIGERFPAFGRAIQPTFVVVHPVMATQRNPLWTTRLKMWTRPCAPDAIESWSTYCQPDVDRTADWSVW